MDGFLRFEPAFCCGDDLVRYHDLLSNKLWFQGVIRRGSETSDVWTERGCSRITVTRFCAHGSCPAPASSRALSQSPPGQRCPQPPKADRTRRPPWQASPEASCRRRRSRNRSRTARRHGRGFDLLGKPVRQPGEPAEKLQRCPGSNGFADRVRRASDPCPPANLPDRRIAAPSFDGKGLRGRVGGLRRGHLTAAAPDRGRKCDLGPRPDAIPAVPQREDGADPP